MLIIEKSISYEPIKLPVTFRGANIELMIRPIDGEAMEHIREKAKIYRYAEHPVLKTQVLGSVVDDNLCDLELFDFVIASFSGVGSAKDKPWPCDKEHKSKLMYLSPGENDALPLHSVVLKAARDLAAERRALLQAEIKNS